MIVKKTTADGLVDIFIGQLIEKLIPIDGKPGLYKLPDFEFNFPIIGKKKLNLGSSIAYEPKEGTITIVNLGNQLSTFLLNMKGYCFLYEILPNKKKWIHEKHKWWVVQIPLSVDRVDEISKFLKIMTNTAENESLSFFDADDVKYLKDEITAGRKITPKNEILSDPWEREIYQKTGFLIFQNLTLQNSIGFREIKFSEFNEDTVGGNNLPIRYRKEQSGVYRASFFPYGFIVPEAEDANNIPTRVALMIKAQCVNPYIAHVISGDPFATFSAAVLNSVTEVIRESYVHEVSKKIALTGKKLSKAEKELIKSENIIVRIQNRVIEELRKSFFGFDFGMTNDSSEIVQIIDIDIVGPLAVKLKEIATKTFTSQVERDNELLNAINKALVAKELAKAQFAVNDEEADAILRNAAKLQMEPLDYIKTFIVPDQKIRTVGAFKPGGATLNTSSILEKLID